MEGKLRRKKPHFLCCRERQPLDFARDPDPFDSAQGHPEPVERMSLLAVSLSKPSNGLPSRNPTVRRPACALRATARLCILDGPRRSLGEVGEARPPPLIAADVA